MKIALIGFMGSGKTTVAKLLARRLELPAHEMDEIILTRSGRARIADIFSRDGEAHFRRLESGVAAEMGALSSAIVSCGGGIIGNPQNLIDMRRHGGIIVYLRTRFETIEGRIGSDGDRPLFKDLQRAQELYLSREAQYAACADIVSDTDGRTPDQVVDDICAQISARRPPLCTR